MYFLKFYIQFKELRFSQEVHVDKVPNIIQGISKKQASLPILHSISKYFPETNSTFYF